MVITSNAEGTSIYCDEGNNILAGRSIPDHLRHQTPSKSFYVVSAITSAVSPRSSAINGGHSPLSNDSITVKSEGADDEFLSCQTRSRTNTFGSQDNSLPSTSSLDLDGKQILLNSVNNSSPLSITQHSKTAHKVKSIASRKRNSKTIESGTKDKMKYLTEKELMEHDELMDEDFGDEVLSDEDAGFEIENCRDDEAGTSGNSQIEKRHKCDICGKAFPYMSILESHKRCHTGEKPFSCHFCDKKFAQKATLQVHERTHTGERPYKCKYCEKTFAQYGTKTVHEKSAHLGIRNYKCPKCNKFLSSPSALYTHKKTHGDKSFQCPFCPKQFTLKNYLKLHIKQVHEHGERKHVCKFCSKTFAYAGSLQVHVRTHTGERPYICKFCPKAFASQGNLQSHERTHTGERPYICRYCGRSFIQKSQLTAHEAIHTYGNTGSDAGDNLHDDGIADRNSNDNYAVEANNNNLNFIDKHKNGTVVEMNHEACGSADISVDNEFVENQFPGVSSVPDPNLPDEQSSIQGKDRRQNEFVCKYCGKRYAYASSLYVHTRLHTGERPFRCNFCDKSFTNQGNMQVHLRVHTGEKPYKCEACGKSYAQKVGLKIHQEQCQIYMNRRGSVMTMDSESSPPSAASLDEPCTSENERSFIERILGDERRLLSQKLSTEPSFVTSSKPSTNVGYNGTELEQTNSSVISQLVELQNVTNAGKINQGVGNIVNAKLPTDLEGMQCNVSSTIYNTENYNNIHISHPTNSHPMIPNTTINNTFATLQCLPSVGTSLSSITLNTLPQAVDALTAATAPIITSAQLTPNAIDVLMRHTQQNGQQQSLANLLMELEQQQFLHQQQQQQQFQLSTLKTILGITSSTNSSNGPIQTAPVFGNKVVYQLPLPGATKIVPSQQMASCLEQPSTSSLMTSQAQPFYTQLQTQPQQILQVQQKQHQPQHNAQMLQEILQLRLIEQQQQQNILASIQQVLPLLSSSANSTVINDCNNNNVAMNSNIDSTTLTSLMTMANSIHAPAAIPVSNVTSPRPALAPYSNINYNYGNTLSAGLNSEGRTFCKEPLLPPSTSTVVNSAIGDESLNLVIAAAEALRSLSKQQCVDQTSQTGVAPS